MKSRMLLALPLASLLFVTQSRDAAAQSTGFVHLKTHIASVVTPYVELGVYRTWQQGSSGLVETFTQEFAPGTHTFARVEAIYEDCRLSAQNITFTISAGKWTDVDVPMTFQDCSVGIEYNFIDGIGNVNFSVIGNTGTLPVADCRTGYDQAKHVVITNFHSCQGTVPYGATITATVTPGAFTSCCDTTVSIVATESFSGTHGFFERPFSFADTTASPPPQSGDANTDLSIERIGGTEGGQVSTATYRVVNHGPNRAEYVQVDAGPGSPNTFSDANAIGTRTVADGNCRNDACYTRYLPVGDTTTFFFRISGIPQADTTSRHDALPFGLQSAPSSDCIVARVYSSSNNDPNPSNNTVPCLDTGVPVTVALGGATPANRTVQLGALNVPMLDFMLTPASQQTVNSVTVQAHGTGDDHVDVTAVNLYVDKNGNGQVDAGDSLLATSAFAANDGSVTMNVSPLYSIAAPTNFLVTYSFSATFAQRLGGGLSLAMLPLLFLPAVWRRKRVAASLMLAMVTTLALTACGGDSGTGPPPPPGSSVTFQSTLTGVNVSGTDVAGVSLAGATITVDK